MKNLDSIVNKWISRKLFVFIIATLLMSFSKLESGDWTVLAVAYLSTQTVLDAVVAYNKSKNGGQGIQ